MVMMNTAESASLLHFYSLFSISFGVEIQSSAPLIRQEKENEVRSQKDADVAEILHARCVRSHK